jgi:hypothetical protein
MASGSSDRAKRALRVWCEMQTNGSVMLVMLDAFD